MSIFCEDHKDPKNIKVCGSAKHCLDLLQISANEHNVIYKVSIGHSPTKNSFTNATVRPSGHFHNNCQQLTIPIQLMWRSSYKEYDNFM